MSTISAGARSASEADSLLERDRNIFFNQASTSPSTLALARAEGSWVEDTAGKRYLDWHGNNCHNVGYAHPRVTAAIHDQLAELAFVPRGFTASTPVRLAEKLAALWPGDSARVSLVPGGSSAVETALGVARVYTGRSRIISFYGAYHGRSAGALSVSGPARGRSAKLGPLVPGTIFVPPFHAMTRQDMADPDTAARRSLEAIKDALEFEGDIAALIAEPIRNGPYTPPDWYWIDVRSLCQQHGTLLIFDEIPVGLGRTGAMFASSHFGVVPDMTLIGKSLGGTAMPLAALIADERLNCSPELNLHYYTHEKNPLTAAAGLATLNVLMDERLSERAARLGAQWLPELERMGRGCSVVSDVRGAGLMFGIGFHTSEGPANRESHPAARFVSAAREQGLLVNGPRDGAVTLAPPLNILDADLSLGMEVVARALQSTH
ncbi:MAG: aminotransferase class III-fold pyridoxal phosphate-dependent enzyme [Chromatiales bacterium]|nr:aminotransferase class III-fold pyridoxal phosphate-dependent enzyme [Chromatiales bacterium]